MNHLKGKYICFSGKDFTGKSTLVSMLYDYLKIPVLSVREPGYLEFGSKVRELIKDSNISGMTRMFLYLADRAETSKYVEQHLEKGFTVISDRCYFCHLAYQMTEEDVNSFLTMDDLNVFNMGATRYLVPDYLFYINSSNSKIMERIENDKEKEAGWDFFENLDFLNRVDENFNYALENFVDKKIKLNIIDTTNTTKEEAFKKVLERLGI